MNERDRRQLRKRLEDLDPRERQTLYRRAAKLRKASREDEKRKPRRKGKRVEDWLASEDAGRAPPRSRRGGDSLDEWVGDLLRDVEGAPQRTVEDPGTPRDGEEIGLVVGLRAGRCQVAAEDNLQVSLECRLPPELAGMQRTGLAVGDRVAFVHEHGPEGSEGVVERVLPRTTTLSRPDPGPGPVIERVIAANVDVVLVVAAVQSPPLRPRLIDRYLIAIEQGGAQAIVCLSKFDLLTAREQTELEVELDPYVDLGVSLLPCSTVDGRGISELREAVQGRICVLVGQSGVGKSSLLNSLCPQLSIETRTIGESTGKGRHTTTSSSLYDLGAGAKLIDTPGVREFGLWSLTRQQLQEYFHEFDGHRGDCRFADCLHIAEPDCGVRAAVSEGSIAAVRYDSYVRLAATL